jgi:hypothetical protein
MELKRKKGKERKKIFFFFIITSSFLLFYWSQGVTRISGLVIGREVTFIMIIQKRRDRENVTVIYFKP